MYTKITSCFIEKLYNFGCKHKMETCACLQRVQSLYYFVGVRAVGLVSSPLIKASKRNRNVTSLMHITDWLPTLVNIAGDNTSIEVDGFNQWDVIKEGTDSQRQVS